MLCCGIEPLASQLGVHFEKLFRESQFGNKAMTFTFRGFHVATSQCAKHRVVSFKERTSGSLEPLFPISEGLHQIK
jgi:hypothetical protein